MSNIGEKEKLKLIKEYLRKLSVSLKFVLVYYIQARNSEFLFHIISIEQSTEVGCFRVKF